MEILQPAKRLRIYIGEADRYEGKPLYETIVQQARKTGLGGATVFRCPMGYGKTSHLHTAKILQLSMDLPIVVEIIDQEAVLRKFVQETLRPMMAGGLVTLEDVEVMHYLAKPVADGK